MPETRPTISMKTSVRYVTQSSVWDVHVTGKLTNRRIAKYQAQGYYDGIKRDERAAQRKAKSAKKQLKVNVLAILLS